MLKVFNRKKKDNKGFTLVELVIVVAILAILVGILAPQYTKYVEKSRKAADASNLENLVTAFKTVASDGTEDHVDADTYTITISKNGSKIAESGKFTQEILPKGQERLRKGFAAVFDSFVGENWRSDIKLKSKKWTNDGTLNGKPVDEIQAILTVGNDGSVTVKYIPESIKVQSNQ